MATAGKPTCNYAIASLRWWIGGYLFASTVINYIDRQGFSLLAPYLNPNTTGLTGDPIMIVAGLVPFVGMILVLLLVRNTEATDQGLVRRI